MARVSMRAWLIAEGVDIADLPLHPTPPPLPLVMGGAYTLCHTCRGKGIRKGSKHNCSRCGGSGILPDLAMMCWCACGCDHTTSLIICDDCTTATAAMQPLID
jgi:hypothetical protein